MKNLDLTDEEKGLLERVESHLRNRTANAIAANKRDRGLQAAVKAVYQARGQFAQYVSEEVKEFANLFFEAARQGWAKLDSEARTWGKYERLV